MAACSDRPDNPAFELFVILCWLAKRPNVPDVISRSKNVVIFHSRHIHSTFSFFAAITM
jgi:hypothetical protein